MRVGRVSVWYFGSIFPSATASRMISSMTMPFSACMQMRVPFRPACRKAR